MHIELTEMLRCPEPHEPVPLVLATGEMLGRMVRKGVVGCPVCQREYPIGDGIVDFTGAGRGTPGPAARGSSSWPPDYAQTLQALLELSGPGGIVVLLGDAARHAGGLAGLMGGIHFVGINAPREVEESPVLSLLLAGRLVPLRDSVARGVVVGADTASDPWLGEAHRVLLRGRRWVAESERVRVPGGILERARGQGLLVGEKR